MFLLLNPFGALAHGMAFNILKITSGWSFLDAQHMKMILNVFYIISDIKWHKHHALYTHNPLQSVRGIKGM